MLNSIFRKWLVASVAISFAILLVLTVTVSWLVQRDYYRQGLKQLEEHAKAVEQAYVQLREGNIKMADFRKELKRLEQEHGVMISIIGKKVKYLKEDLYEVGVRPDIKSWVVSVNEGNRIERIAKFRKQDEAKMLIVGVPLMNNNQIVASAFIYSPAANVKEIAAPIRRSIWLLALACAGPLILLLWFATRRMVRPIRRMGEAAASIASGDFTSRVEIRGDDEVARLGSSFNEMAERMEMVEEQRRRLIMEISHELRTPLTSIRGTLQAMSDGILTKQEQSEFVALSLEETLRLGKLIDNIHELSAFEEHRIDFEFKKADLSELVDQTVQQFRPKAEAMGMIIRTEGDREKSLFVHADPSRIKQVLVNLIGNSLEHNKKGTTVVVRLQGQSHKVRLTVQDNGQGIAGEHLPHLFERLYKAESSRTSKGSGLGLTISRHIVLAHGGMIAAESELGKGTQIHVELPLVRR